MLLPSNRRAEIIIALVGLIATLGSATLSNWDKIFSHLENRNSDKLSREAASLHPSTATTASPNELAERDKRVSRTSLSGEWRLTNTIQATTYRPFVGLEIGYRIFIEQHGNEFEGVGEKLWENGKQLPTTAQTRITLNGRSNDLESSATCTEEGARRSTTCRFSWRASPGKDELVGTFSSTAANSRGVSRLTRLQ
jgi:hypothetical protein